MDLDNLAGHLSEVLLDTRTTTDPWGWGISATIGSTGSPEWKQFVLEQNANTPGAEKVRRVIAKTVTSNMGVGGQRQKKTLSSSEQARRIEDTLSEPGEVVIDLLDLRRKKPGIARILVKKLGPFTRGGVPIDLSTPEKVEALLDHAAYEFTDPADQIRKTRSIPMEKTGAGGKPELDSTGEPLPNPYAGMNVGDALAQWLLDDADETAAFVEARRADALEPSSAGSAGTTGTGLSEAPIPVES